MFYGKVELYNKKYGSIFFTEETSYGKREKHKFVLDGWRRKWPG